MTKLLLSRLSRGFTSAPRGSFPKVEHCGPDGPNPLDSGGLSPFCPTTINQTPKYPNSSYIASDEDLVTSVSLLYKEIVDLRRELINAENYIEHLRSRIKEKRMDSNECSLVDLLDQVVETTQVIRRKAIKDAIDHLREQTYFRAAEVLDGFIRNEDAKQKQLGKPLEPEASGSKREDSSDDSDTIGSSRNSRFFRP